MAEQVSYDRRRFLRSAGMTIAATELDIITSASAQSRNK
jgi:hypothetical protein